MSAQEAFFDETSDYTKGSDEDDAEDETLPPFDDGDTCNAQDLEQLFQMRGKIVNEVAVSLKKDYILGLCTDSSFTRAAAGLSDASVQIFDLNAGRSLSTATSNFIPPPNHNNIKMCGVRFLDETPNNLLVGGSDGTIQLYDLRTQEPVARFTEDINCTSEFSSGTYQTPGKVSKNINCFDSNSNARILCVGSERAQNFVYLLFYDIREGKQLGAYSESHEDDITALRFHPQNPNILCSGSEDGLINVFDIREESEDDALLTTINTEDSVRKLNWHKNVYDQDLISCVSHTDFKLYMSDEGDLVAGFEREQITSAMKRKNEANCNIINAHSIEDDGIFLLSGTNQRKGEVLRSLRLQNKELLPLMNFEGNKQIVRESVFDAKSGALLTAGESGIITLWTTQGKNDPPSLISSSNTLKHKSKKSNKKAPY